jgi:hypothetical protein
MKIVIACVAALALATAGSASAAKGPAAHILKGRALVRQSAVYLGISVKDLRTQLRTGKSLAQVADATPSKSSAGLLSTLVGLAQAKLDKLVAAGKLAPAREPKVLDRVTRRLQRAIARVHPVKP